MAEPPSPRHSEHLEPLVSSEARSPLLIKRENTHLKRLARPVLIHRQTDHHHEGLAVLERNNSSVYTSFSLATAATSSSSEAGVALRSVGEDLDGIFFLDPARKKIAMPMDQKIMEFRIARENLVDAEGIINLSRAPDRDMLAAFEKSMEHSVQRALTLFENVTVVSALFLSITMSALLIKVVSNSMVEKETDFRWIQVYRALMYISTTANVMSLWFSARWYIYLTSWCIDVWSQMYFLTHANLSFPVNFMVIGFTCCLLAVPVAIGTFYGALRAAIATVVVVVAFVYIAIPDIVWYRTFIRQFQKYLMLLKPCDRVRFQVSNFDTENMGVHGRMNVLSMGGDVVNTGKETSKGVFRFLHPALSYFHAGPRRTGLEYGVPNEELRSTFLSPANEA